MHTPCCVIIHDPVYTHLYAHSVLCHYSWSSVYHSYAHSVLCLYTPSALCQYSWSTVCSSVSTLYGVSILDAYYTASVSTLYGVSIHDAYYTHLYPHCTVSVSMMHTIPICIHTPVCTQTPCCQNPWSIIYPFLSTLQSVSVVTLRAVSESMIHNIPTRIHTPACSSVLTPGVRLVSTLHALYVSVARLHALYVSVHTPCFICQYPRSMLYMSVSTPHLL